LGFGAVSGSGASLKVNLSIAPVNLNGRAGDLLGFGGCGTSQNDSY
jgi:hypothetical protein